MKPSHLLFGLPILFLSLGCQGHHDHAKIKPKYQVTTPLQETTVITRDYVSQIRAIQHIEVRALEEGYLEQILVDEGQSVKAGQPLFQIMPRLYQAELGKATAAAEFAEIEYQNTLKLAQGKVVAPSELALAKAKLDKAKALLQLSQVHLDFTQLKAPFDGIVGRFVARKGSLLDKGDLLTTLSDNREMWVYFNVPEAEYLEYKRTNSAGKQLKVRLETADHRMFEHEGIITAIEADFDNQTGNIAYRATFSNPSGILRHGQTGKILVDFPVNDAIVIPQAAVFELLDKHFVFVVDDSGKVQSREVAIRNQLADVYLIASGLQPTDKILLEGQRKVRDGDLIDPKVLEPKKVLSSLSVYAE